MSPLYKRVWRMSCYFEVFSNEQTPTVDVFTPNPRLDEVVPFGAWERFVEYSRKSQFQGILNSMGADMAAAMC